MKPRTETTTTTTATTRDQIDRITYKKLCDECLQGQLFDLYIERDACENLYDLAIDSIECFVDEIESQLKDEEVPVEEIERIICKIKSVKDELLKDAEEIYYSGLCETLRVLSIKTEADARRLLPDEYHIDEDGIEMDWIIEILKLNGKIC